jgi:hypothetical protein
MYSASAFGLISEQQQTVSFKAPFNPKREAVQYPFYTGEIGFAFNIRSCCRTMAPKSQSSDLPFYAQKTVHFRYCRDYYASGQDLLYRSESSP